MATAFGVQPVLARMYGLQCAMPSLWVLLLVSGPPLVQSNVGDGHSPTSVSASFGAEREPARTLDAEVESGYGPWAFALAAGLLGLWLLMPAPRPASSEQEMKSKRAEKFSISSNASQAKAPQAQVAATAAAASAGKAAATGGTAAGAHARPAIPKVQAPASTADRHFFINGQTYNPGPSALSFFQPSSKAQPASKTAEKSRNDLPSTVTESSSANTQTVQGVRGKQDSSQAAGTSYTDSKAELQRLRAKDEPISTTSASHPAVVQKVEPQNLKVRLRFMAGAQDEEVAVDASWTVAHWMREVAKMPLVRSRSSASSFQLVFAGRVLGQTPDAILGQLFAGPGVPVVLVVERSAPAAAGSSYRAAVSASASSSAGSTASTARVITVSRPEAANRLWASLGVRWAHSQYGSLPHGAAVCGHTAAGVPTYLARGRHAGGMVIGEARKGYRGCHAAYGGRTVVLSDYEVLCVGSMENGVRMRFAASRSSSKLPPAGAVPLGWEADGRPLFGARAAHAEGLHLGKTRPGLGCRVAYAGAEVELSNFEVLCFGLDERLSRARTAATRATVAVTRHVRENSSSGSSSGSERDTEDEEVLGMIASFGVALPLPAACCMNAHVEAAPKEVPQAILACLPGRVSNMRKLSDGWHEGYEVAFQVSNAPVRRTFCRIWRSEVGYHRLEVPVGPEIELKAMELARAAGLPTPQLLDRGAGLPPAVGLCDRGDARPAAFALFTFVEGAVDERAAEKAVTRSRPRWVFELSLMVKLHKYSLGPAEATAPLARFENWREQLDYLANLANCECGGVGPQAALAVAAVQREFAEANIPELPPALCHMDWHLGNVLVNESGELLAVLDWEFAGIADPRFDLARYVRRYCFPMPEGVVSVTFKDLQDIWEQYSQLRFGQPASQSLGPLDPWMALESLAVLVFASVMCARTAAAGDATGAVGPDQRSYVPRCDLMEWVEDMQTAIYQLRHLGLLD